MKETRYRGAGVNCTRNVSNKRLKMRRATSIMLHSKTPSDRRALENGNYTTLSQESLGQNINVLRNRTYIFKYSYAR